MVEKGDLESLRKSATKENVDLQQGCMQCSSTCMTPLMSAASHGNAAMTLHLLAVTGTVTRVTGRFGRSAMHWAAVKTDSVDVARLLLAAGAEADGRDCWRQTPLMNAALFNHPRMLQLLLAHGADLNMRGEDGKTAQDLASSHGHSTCSSLLSAW
jgi:ankyrin repeat protein